MKRTIIKFDYELIKEINMNTLNTMLERRDTLEKNFYKSVMNNTEILDLDSQHEIGTRAYCIARRIKEHKGIYSEDLTFLQKNYPESIVFLIELNKVCNDLLPDDEHFTNN